MFVRLLEEVRDDSNAKVEPAVYRVCDLSARVVLIRESDQGNNIIHFIGKPKLRNRVEIAEG